MLDVIHLMSMKKMAKYFLMIILWLILPLVCVEVIMIVLEPYLFKGFYQYDPELGFRVRSYIAVPDGSVANQFGFNAKDYPLQRRADIFRILVVGDSFSWAGGREGNYTALLERKFDEHCGVHKIDVINAGYPMTHTGEQLAMLKKYGLQYNPDLVILGFFAGNDFVDADPNRKRIVVNDISVDIDKRNELKALGYPIIPNSRLLLFVEQKYKVISELRKAKAEYQKMTPASEKQEEEAGFSEEAFLNIERSRLEFFNLHASREGRFHENINYIFQSISKMDVILKSRNTKFIVAIYPDEFQVNQGLTNAILGRFNLRKEDFDLELVQNLLKEFLKSKGISYIDFLDRFRTEGQRQELYLFRNTHWNNSGNRLAADILFEHLVKSRMVHC